MYSTIALFTTLLFCLSQNIICFRSFRQKQSLCMSASIATSLETPYNNDLRPTDPIDKIIATETWASANPQDTVAKALEAMQLNKRSSVVIIDESNNVKGIFTERDFIVKVLENNLGLDTTLDSVMTKESNLILANGLDSIKDCREIMLRNKIRHLPVVDNNLKCIGVISLSQLIRSLQKETTEKESATFYGTTLKEVELQSKSLANEFASSEGVGRQDALRTAYVVSGAIAGAALLQAGWVHDNEYLSMAAVFILGYVGIIFENYFEFNKAAIALLMCTALWTIYANEEGTAGMAIATSKLTEKVAEVSEVVFFILGAMTIVEIVDAHQGFKVVTDKINSSKKRSLMGIIAFITFFMSAILDNLTTTIVMVSVIKKILPDTEDRKLFGALIVIAANAGGAWTPIGDVTTTMLWINGQITALPTMTGLFLPSLVSTIIPTWMLQQQIPEESKVPESTSQQKSLAPRGSLVFATGVFGLLSVPVFKAVTGLPPYLGMLASLGVMWTLTDAIHAGDREELMAPAALRKIDTSGVLFFLGILMSVGALDSAGILRSTAEVLDKAISSDALLASMIGVASAVIDNVPLVAATMGMYPLASTPEDSQLWQLIAYCAGTGGSLLVIGSAAGVALMGLEKVDFLWYAKRVTVAAFMGYVGGLAVYLAQSGSLGSIFTSAVIASESVIIPGISAAMFN